MSRPKILCHYFYTLVYLVPLTALHRLSVCTHFPKYYWACFLLITLHVQQAVHVPSFSSERKGGREGQRKQEEEEEKKLKGNQISLLGQTKLVTLFRRNNLAQAKPSAGLDIL